MPRSKSKAKINLSAIIYREEGVWLAHCLEMDVVAEGDKPQKAFKDLDELCELQIKTALEEGDLETVFRPAPPEIWKMFWMGREKTQKKHRTFGPVKRFEARELELA
jgi:predicted RNase H-like HicB family nuclease